MHICHIFEKTTESCCIPCEENISIKLQNNVGVKSKIVTFATSMYYWVNEQKSTYFAQVILELERKLLKVRLCLIKFLFTHILRTGKGPVDYQGWERHGCGPVWLLYLSRKLLSSLSEIVSLVSFGKGGCDTG